VPETVSVATDLDLISLLRAIPDPGMRRGVHISYGNCCWVAMLGILDSCQSMRDLEQLQSTVLCQSG
jgi:hypothetical protein